MAEAPEICSERLSLRAFVAEDRVPFARLNADREVTEFLLAPLTRSESDALAARIDAHLEAHGFGLWAVERSDSGDFIGFTGLSIPAFEASFTPCVEIA